MTQRERIFAVIERKGYITNRDLKDLGLSHVGRNRLTEQEGREYFAAKGLKVVYHNADDFLDHRWTLEPLNIPKFDEAGQAQMPLGL